MRKVYITLFVLGISAFEIACTATVTNKDECGVLDSCEACVNNTKCAFAICQDGKICQAEEDVENDCEKIQKKTDCNAVPAIIPPSETVRGPAVKENDNGNLENCSQIMTCEECGAANCSWKFCTGDQICGSKMSDMCIEISCNESTTVSPTTTTDAPTTTEDPATTTTDATTTVAPPPDTTTAPPDTTTAPPDTTTAPPDTTTAPPDTTTAPPDTTTASPDTTTAPPPTTTEDPETTTSTTTTTVTPCPDPEPRHFDAASFFGGMMLAVALIAIAYAAWKFYKTRNVRNYLTLHETVHM